MRQINSIHFSLFFELSLENSNIWAEARCKEVILSRAVDNIITSQGRKSFDGIIFLLLFVKFSTHWMHEMFKFFKCRFRQVN